MDKASHDFYIMEENFTPVPVLNGLKLKQKNQELPFRTFHYAPIIRYPPDLLPIDWYPLSLYVTVGDHIRIHEQKEGDNLLACIKEYRDNHAKAVIVVNSSEDSSLPVDLTQPLINALNNFLVAVLPSSEGSALIDYLQVQFEDDELYAKMDFISSESTQLAVLGEDDQKAVLGTTSWLGKIFGGRSNVYDLKGEIKKIIFDNEVMKPITLDAGLFTMVMINFSIFEKCGKSDTTSVNELLRRFHHYLESSFHFEFPFYLIVAYRLRKFRPLYDCEELNPLITKCINMFEVLPAHQVTQTLLTFLDKGDFDVTFGSEVSESYSVFTLLATAAKNLMNHSMQVKRILNNSHERIVYYRLLWISVFLKCLREKGTVTRMDLTIWNREFILKIPKEMPITEDMIKDFTLGLELSQLLKLPIKNQFTICHLGCFLANEESIRPFSHLRDVVTGLEEFIMSDKELLVHILINLRPLYAKILQVSPDSDVVGRASVDGTLLGTISEGISFLDNITELWTRKEWHKGEQHEDFRTERREWMMLLLGAVKVTDPTAPQLLKKFLAPKRGSIFADRAYIVQFIQEDTRAKFSDLTIQQFFLLFRSFRIWPIPFVYDYLMQCHIHDVNIADPTWSEFFVEVSKRYADDNRIQNFIMDFIIRVAEKYSKAQRSHDFIPDVLQLNIASLFAPTSEKDHGNMIGNRFTDFLQDYIRRNNLRPVIIERFQEMLSLVSENEQTMYHGIVLNILQQEVIHVLELKSLQDDSIQTTKQFKDLLKFSVNTVNQKVSAWFGILSPRQQFCWGVISAGCSKIPISAESFKWLISLQSVISQLGSIFNSYCNSRQLLGHACLLTESLPKEVAECQWDDVRKYFNWIRQVQNILCIWQNKFLKNNVNFDEILVYASHIVAISSLSRAVRASEYVMDLQDIQEVKETFMICFERLNCYLIQYIPNHPESKYCTLVELLLYYGVHLPPDLQQKFQGKVIFPGNGREIPDGQKLNNVINASVHCQFEPGQDVSLVVTKSFSLYDLQRTLDDLQTFLEPIIEHMDMLVFFHLEKSDIFSKHLHKRLNDLITAAASPRIEQTFTAAIPSFKPSLNLSICDKTKTEGVPMAILLKGLNAVRNLLLKVLKGTATYSDIVAGDTLNLHELKVEEEFGKLRRFSEQLDMNLNYCEGLEGMRRMLEFFQFTHHIEQIRQVCEQFKLTKCLQDDQFKKLLDIVKEFETVESRAHLTPTEASVKMGFIKKVLCLKEHKNNYSCLELFPAISNSVSFYQFIKDKQFVGQKGRTLFCEQYQLITAQLQREEYDENILNHLRAAFKFIAPFTESDILFSDLMKKVTKLDATNGLKLLETVNENIALIAAWFSRAEGDTTNVANELQHILSTGLYQFQLSSDSCNVLLIYQTMQTVWTHKRARSNLAQPLEEYGELESNGNKQGVTLPTVFPSPMPSSLDAKKEDPFGNTMGAVEQRWSNEQIADFVRKLGFLDSRKEGGDHIRKFLHLNLTANRMMELFMKLYELGHPKYQRNRSLPTLLCSTSGIEADKQVAEFEQTLVQWRNQVNTLRHKYTWLLFFSIPKALCLYSMIDDLNINYDAITREISFLFENSSNVRAKLRTIVKAAIDSMFIKMGGSAPMEFLGKLLQLVCSDNTLAPHLLKQRCCDTTKMTSISVKPLRLSITSTTASGDPMGIFQLHYAPGYTQEQILRLITLIYKGVPECFEVLQCSPTTTAEELFMFMERVKYHPLPYLVLLVNRLPYKMQEQLSLLMKNISQIPEDIGFGKGVGMVPTVHFIETSPSILREMPFVTYYEHKKDDPGLPFKEASQLCQRKIFQPADFSGIKLVYGYPGDGKTHYIRRQLSKCPTTLCVSVNEAFTPLNTINSLNSLPHTAPESAIFFNFTINPCLDIKQNHKEHCKMLELMDSIGWFFYHMLVLGYIEDPATGTSYRLPGGQSLAIYIEVPSQDRKHNIDDCLRLCNQYIPILGLLGTPYKIHQSTPYCIDEEVQLVCKYLRAYNIGGIKGIDRLYEDSKLHNLAQTLYT